MNKDTLNKVIDFIKERYMPYPNPEIMRPLVSTTRIIEKIETQAMARLIEELEGMKDG